MLFTLPVWPIRVAEVEVCRFQILIVLSEPAEVTRWSSSRNMEHYTDPVWPSNLVCISSCSIFRRMTVQSSPAVTRNCPDLEKLTVFTLPECPE